MGSDFTIGVTGHRHIHCERIPSIAEKIEAFFKTGIARHGTENIIVLSPLAEGVDMLCAKLALDIGLRLSVPLPMNATDYRKDFPESVAAEFDCLLSLADQVFVVSPEEPIPPTPERGFYYRQAGIYVAKYCDVLLAVWDGIERDAPDSAGTWETVKLARQMGKEVQHLAV